MTKTAIGGRWRVFVGKCCSFFAKSPSKIWWYHKLCVPLHPQNRKGDAAIFVHGARSSVG